MLDMPASLWYTKRVKQATQGMISQAMSGTGKHLNRTRHMSHTIEGYNQMTPTVATKTVQRTVFDLATFDDVPLVKSVTIPQKPSTLEDALAAVGNDQAKLLNVIHEGLVSEAMEAGRNDLAGFHVVAEDGEPGEEYAGTIATEEQGKQINATVLNFAKMNGFSKARVALRPILVASLAPKTT